MRGKLFFNGELIDAEITVPLAVGGNQLNDLNNKRANQTATIIIEKNEKYHEDSEIWNSEIFVDYSMSGINIIRRGKLKVNKFTDTHVHLTVYFGLYDLAEKLKDTKITEIDPIDDYINWNISIVKSTLVDDPNNHFVFLFVNSDTFEQTEFNSFGAIHAKRFIPAVRVTHVLELIENYFDIQLSGDLKTDPMIQQLFMPVIDNKYIRDTNFLADRNTDQNISDFLSTNNDTVLRYLRFQNITNATLTNEIEINVTEAGYYSINAAFTPRLETIAISLSNISQIGDVFDLKVNLLLTKNWDGTFINLIASSIANKEVDFTNVPINTVVIFNPIAVGTEINLLTTDKLSLVAYFEFTTSGITTSNQFFYQFLTRQDMSGAIEIVQFNGLFPIFRNLPEMTCMDFLKSLIQKRGYLLDYDDVDEKYIFSYFKDVFSKQAEDWSEFFVSAELTDVYGVTAKENIFQYDNDDYLPENLGSHSHFVNKDTLPNETVILQDKTSATQMQIFRNDFICRLPIIKDDKREFNKIKPRFLLVEKGSIPNVSITDGVSTDPLTHQNLAYFDKLGKEFSLDYAKIVPENYAEYTEILTNYRFYTAKMQLKANILDRDQSIPIYISQLKSKFFVNKINFTSDTELSTVELIKI